MRALGYALILLMAGVIGCAGYSSRIQKPRADLEAGHYDSAITQLTKLAERHDTDELLYLFDLGTSYHLAGKYEEAIQTFLKADKLASKLSYTSVTEEAGTVLLNDQVKRYKGEEFEKILIHVYLAIDYTLLGKSEDALVECRQVNQKLDQLMAKNKEAFDHNAFAKYLAAALFESQGETNDAFVDYRQLHKWIGTTFPYLGPPLLRISDRLKALQELEEYRKAFPEIKSYRLKKGEGEIVAFIESGKSPVKVPSAQFRLVPVFHKRFYGSDFFNLTYDASPERIRTYPLYDIEAVAIKELDANLDAIIAKKVSGVVVKEAAAYGVEKATDSKVLGALTSVLLHVSDQADLRSWTTLPAKLQVARFALPAGKHTVRLEMVSNMGAQSPGVKVWDNVEVKPGKITFLHYRLRE